MTEKWSDEIFQSFRIVFRTWLQKSKNVRSNNVKMQMIVEVSVKLSKVVEVLRGFCRENITRSIHQNQCTTNNTKFCEQSVQK